MRSDAEIALARIRFLKSATSRGRLFEPGWECIDTIKDCKLFPDGWGWQFTSSVRYPRRNLLPTWPNPDSCGKARTEDNQALETVSRRVAGGDGWARRCAPFDIEGDADSPGRCYAIKSKRRAEKRSAFRLLTILPQEVSSGMRPIGAEWRTPPCIKMVRSPAPTAWGLLDRLASAWIE